MNLKNVCLYAKGWYKKSDDIVEDLKKCLDADNYSLFDKRDVSHILMNCISQIPWMMRNGIEYYTLNLLDGVNPMICWKIGYYTKDNYHPTPRDIEKGLVLPEYDFQMAIIHYCLSTLRFMETKDLGGLPRPSKKVLPLTRNPKTIAEFWPKKEKV